MIKHVLVAAVTTIAAFSANATLTGGLAANQSPSSFITLSTANVSGGALYTGNPLPYAAIPTNVATSTATSGTWLAAGPSDGGSATLTVSPSTFVSFLWGSPDTFNSVLVKTTTNAVGTTFTSASFAGLVVLGNQNYASYIGFSATGGELITSLTFLSTGDAFEVSNVSLTAPVPEPETYALMLAGLGVVGFIARRRKAG